MNNLRLVKTEPVANSDSYANAYDPFFEGPISADSLFIMVSVFHKNYSDFILKFNTEKWNIENTQMSERIPGNPSMEQQIKDYIVIDRETFRDGYGAPFVPIDTDYGDAGNIFPLEYRTAGCTSITITSSKPLFGREAGSDLSDLFVLFPETGGDCGVYLFNYESKALLGKMSYDDGMSIKDYLALRPTVLPVCFYHMTQSPVEAPVETDLTIDIGMDDGKHISATTHINLSTGE